MLKTDEQNNYLKMDEDAKERFMMTRNFFKPTNDSNPNHLYKPRSGDVIIVGPSKSGTFWMQNILHQIRTKGDLSFRRLFEVTWFIWHPTRAFWDMNAEQVCNPRVYKCHLLYGVLPTSPDVKHVFIIRDPIDVAYSSIKFYYRHHGGTGDVDDNTMMEYLTRRYQEGTDYFHFFESWWPHRNDQNVFFIFYEDLKTDSKFIIEKIAKFIRVDLNEEELDRVCQYTSFQFMAENEEKFKGNIVELMAEVFGCDTDWQPTQHNIRKDGGQVGQGTKNVSPELKAFCQHLWQETMEKSFGYKNYVEMYAEHSRLPLEKRVVARN